MKIRYGCVKLTRMLRYEPILMDKKHKKILAHTCSIKIEPSPVRNDHLNEEKEGQIGQTQVLRYARMLMDQRHQVSLRAEFVMSDHVAWSRVIKGRLPCANHVVRSLANPVASKSLMQYFHGNNSVYTTLHLYKYSTWVILERHEVGL